MTSRAQRHIVFARHCHQRCHMRFLRNDHPGRGFLIAVALALAASQAVAIDLSVAPLPLTYECVEVRSVGLEETYMGQMRVWDGKSDDAYRYVVHGYEHLREQADTNPRKNFDASPLTLRETWDSCRLSKGALGLRGGQLEFCLSTFMKQKTGTLFYHATTSYCQTGGDYRPNLGGWSNVYSILDCQGNFRMDTDKLLVLQVRTFFQNAMGVSHRQCMRLDK